jgi:hypothetical protein
MADEPKPLDAADLDAALPPLIDKMDALIARHRGLGVNPQIPTLTEIAPQTEHGDIPVLTDVAPTLGDELMFTFEEIREAPPVRPAAAPKAVPAAAGPAAPPDRPASGETKSLYAVRVAAVSPETPPAPIDDLPPLDFDFIRPAPTAAKAPTPIAAHPPTPPMPATEPPLPPLETQAPELLMPELTFDFELPSIEPAAPVPPPVVEPEPPALHVEREATVAIEVPAAAPLTALPLSVEEAPLPAAQPEAMVATLAIEATPQAGDELVFLPPSEDEIDARVAAAETKRAALALLRIQPPPAVPATPAATITLEDAPLTVAPAEPAPPPIDAAAVAAQLLAVLKPEVERMLKVELARQVAALHGEAVQRAFAALHPQLETLIVEQVKRALDRRHH